MKPLTREDVDELYVLKARQDRIKSWQFWKMGELDQIFQELEAWKVRHGRK